MKKRPSQKTSKNNFKAFGGIFDWDAALAHFEELSKHCAADSLWDNPEEAQKILKERTRLEESIKEIRSLEEELESHLTLFDLAEEENDPATKEEALELLKGLQEKSRKAQLAFMLSGEADHSNCFIEIHAGAGGTEAQDWAEMLLRMYMRWAERQNFTVSFIEESAGEEAGIKSATIKVSGDKAYGWAKTESGVHRLVRISPYDSNSRRHTSFASVWVFPEVDSNIDIAIEDKDIRIDTYRASGAGGQHVNKTDSAIRITHIPTGIVVQCQNDRSQHRNKAQAFSMLKARIYELELRKQEEKAQEAATSKSEIGWGHQIRSYVLHPYQMVKDLRTSIESGNPQAVLDGDIQKFIEAALSERVGATKES